MHRTQSLASPTFHLIEILACAFAALALLTSVIALARLWVTGGQGWGMAISGLLLSLLCLSPFIYGLVLFTRYPALTDVSTANTAPALQLEQVANAFPNVHPRTYPLDTRRVFTLVDGLVKAQGWQVQTVEEPATELDQGVIEAVDTTLFGWRDRIVLDVGGDTRSARVDMRSFALGPTISDLGANGRRIEDFLAALDTEVTRFLRDDPSALLPYDAGEPGSLDASGAPIPAEPIQR